jgi:excisionase family DNA binding protein
MCLGETASVTDGVSGDPVAPLLTYKQAARVLGVTERTVWTLVHRGALQAVRFGRSVRIDPADLRAFIERSKQGGAA